MDATPIVGPAAADNQTVILWAVGVLVAVVALVAKILWAKLQENERRLHAELERANQKNEQAQQTIASLQGGVIMEQQKTQMMTNNAMEKMATAVDNMSETLITLRGKP